MLLTCPQCSAKYNVADGAIPPSGRTVRCAACGNSWRAMPAGAIGYNATTAKAPTAAETKKNGLLAKLGLGSKKAKPAKPGKLEPHELARKKALNQIKTTHRLAAAVPWAISLSLLVGAFAAAAIYRSDIVRAWPKSATAFAAVGLPANLYGVDIRDITITSSADEKGPKIEVKGVLQSVSRSSEFVPYLKVSLVDAKGLERLSWMVDPGIESLGPGKAHRFTSSRSNPVRGSLKAVITFADPPRKGPRPKPEPPTGKSGLMGAQPTAPAKPADVPMVEHGEGHDAPVAAR
jgi:predicted Zn finger-like uncharacterized protein